MKCEAAVAILASEGLALVSVSRQHARKYFVFGEQPHLWYIFGLGLLRARLMGAVAPIRLPAL